MRLPARTRSGQTVTGSSRTTAPVAYLDSSAIVKQVVEEAESTSLDRWLTRTRHRLVTSRVAWVEVPRAVALVAGEAGLAFARSVLSEHNTWEVTPAVADDAARMAGTHLMSLDAIHLASARACAAEVLVTYDRRLASQTRALGLRVEHPGVLPG